MINITSNLELVEETKMSRENKAYSVLSVKFKGLKLFDVFLKDDIKDKLDFINKFENRK